MYTKTITDGIYRRQVYYHEHLKYCPYGSAGVFHEDGNTCLISYTTTVVKIDADGWLECYGTYSATTRRHIGAFMTEYGNGYTYHDAKACFERGQRLNIRTGERKPIKK